MERLLLTQGGHDEYQYDPVDQVWAIAVFRSVLGRMRDESPYWDLFFDRILTQPPLDHEQVIQKHGFSSPGKASNCLMTAKRQFNKIMEECLLEQSCLTEEFSSTELNQEILFLQQQLLDSQLIQQVVDSLETTGNTKPGADSKCDHSIFGEQILFLDQTANSNWTKSEATQLLEHLLRQPVAAFLEDGKIEYSGTIGELFLSKDDGTSRIVVQALKDIFNAHGKSKTSELPERINVTMTFSMISKFIDLGGEVEQITSMRRDVLTNRLGKLVNKIWIPPDLREIIRSCMAKLLA